MSCDPGSSLETITETRGGSHRRRPPEAVSGEDGRPFAASWICAPTKESGFVSPFSDPFKRPPSTGWPQMGPLGVTPSARFPGLGAPSSPREERRHPSLPTRLLSPPCLIAEKGKMLEPTKDQRRDESGKPGGPRRKLPKKNPPEAPPPRRRARSAAPVPPAVCGECVRRLRAECSRPRHCDFEPGSDVRPGPAIVSGFECFFVRCQCVFTVTLRSVVDVECCCARTKLVHSGKV